MDAKHVERSKFVQKQKEQRQELEKKIKKLKGAMKEAAAKELEELEARQEAELAEFDKAAGVASSASSAKAEPAAPEPAAPSPAQNFRERNWSGLSKKELEEECVTRGIGKKGSKEDLIQKLIIFHQDLASAAKSSAAASSSAPTATAAGEDGAEEDDEEDDDDDEDEEEDEDDEDREEVSPEEMERQGKRERVVQKAIRFLLLEKCKEGFPLDELLQKLEMVKVSGFAPEKCGYKSIEKFVKGQPEAVLKYNRKTQMIMPPKS